MYPQCIKLDTCDSLQNHGLGLKKPLMLRKEETEKVNVLYTSVQEFMFSRACHTNFKFGVTV